MCTRETHERIKRTTADWQAETTPVGIQRFDDGGPSYALANCPRCSSTLARELKETR